jgi:hypothetical protein
VEKSNFCSNIEKRVRKRLRLDELFKKNDIIYVKDKLSLYFIEKIIGDLPKSFTKDPKKASKIVIKYTLDDECNEFLEKLMFNKAKKPTKGISVLNVLTDKEAILFAKYNNIDFEPNKKNKVIKEILDKLENMYPQTRYSLAKSIKSMK